ncbi:MAG: GGDEF domain-containing protein [Victivallales bacterium]|nr:GGDEF domain-containing protein [Victivallales bacterium]
MKILIITNRASTFSLYKEMILKTRFSKREKVELVYADKMADGLKLFKPNNINIIIMESEVIENCNSDGYKNIEKFCDKKPVIILCKKSELTSEKMIKIGAQDCLDKDNLDIDNLEKSILFSMKRFDKLRQLRRQNWGLRNLSEKDPLTEVYNRRGLEVSLRKINKLQKRRLNPLCAILFDCDNFKMINDKYGYSTGDKVLERVSNAIKNRLRETDIVSRIGGDEFMVLLPGVDMGNGIKISEELRNEVSKIQVKNDLFITVSGIVTIIDNGNKFITFSEILKTLGNQLKLSKQSGKNCINYI